MLGRCPNRDPPCACSVWEAWPYWRCSGALATWIGGSAETPGNLQRADICAGQFGEPAKLLRCLIRLALTKVDLGLVHSSAASAIVGLVMGGLRQDGDLETGISPNFLIRNWPPAFKELVTKVGS